MKEFLLFLHPTFGILGAFAAIWFLVEVINVSPTNLRRIRLASLTTMLAMVITWISSGYWYVTYYPADKAIILKSSWAFAHKLIMESKEHVFFITLVLCLLLPIVAWRNNFLTNKSVRVLACIIALLIFLSAFALEGAGGVISTGVRIGLTESAVSK